MSTHFLIVPWARSKCCCVRVYCLDARCMWIFKKTGGLTWRRLPTQLHTAFLRVSLWLSYRASFLLLRPLCKGTSKQALGQPSGHADYWELPSCGCLQCAAWQERNVPRRGAVQRTTPCFPLFLKPVTQLCSFQVSDRQPVCRCSMGHAGGPLRVPPTGRICFHPVFGPGPERGCSDRAVHFFGWWDTVQTPALGQAHQSS